MRLRFFRLLERFIFYSLLASIALTAIPFGTAEAWWQSAFECAVFALSIISILDVSVRGRVNARKFRLLLPLIALILFALIQMLPLRSGAANIAGVSTRVAGTLSADPYETWLFVLRVTSVTLTFALLIHYTNSRRRLRALIALIIGVAVASAFFGLIRQTTQHHGPGFVLPYLMPGQGYAQFINKNHFAFLMEMALGVSLGMVIAGGVRRDRALLYLAAAAPVWIALVLCGSRGGVLSMLSQIIFLALMFNLSRIKVEAGRGERSLSLFGRLARSLVLRVLLIAGLIAAIFVGMIWVGGENLVSKLQSVPGEVSQSRTQSGASRAEIWQATWKMIEAHPILGAGFSGYWKAVTLYHDASGELTPQQAHNDYLEILASGGIVGFAIFVWFVVLFIRETRRALKPNDMFRRAAITGALVGIFGVAVHSFVDFGLHITVNTLMLIALLVIATVDAGATKREGGRAGSV